MSKDIYLSYYRMKRRWVAQEERDTYNGLVSYDSMDTVEMLGEEMIPDSDASNVEDIVVNRLLREKLRCCLSQLTTEERSLICALFYEQKLNGNMRKFSEFPRKQ